MISQTIVFKKRILIADVASIAGPKEAQGPLGKYFDKTLDDDLLGQKSYEIFESKIHRCVIGYLLNKTKTRCDELNFCIGGDLNNELYATSFAMRELDIPFIGAFAACASYGLSIIIASLFIESGHSQKIICSTSSHFSTAERQFRFPLELSSQRPPSSQWTVTGAAALMLNTLKGKIRVESVTIGKVVDLGIKDSTNMGAAMVPAALCTLSAHLSALNRNPSYYDLIITGDLGVAGSELLRICAKKQQLNLNIPLYSDCGCIIFDSDKDSGQGGSGAACSALVFNAYVFKKLLDKTYKRVLFIPTGSLLSKTSCLQRQSIPAIAHAIAFERIQRGGE
ncbi:MAG: stage V sporulation protein AD [Christensenellaceae bacterium]|jgi:stage V sporulation protein AD|nr:stage V sporulation protein AD [Christensenellaceae bacterium]